MLDFSARVDGATIIDDGHGVERDHFVLEKRAFPMGVKETAANDMEWSVSPNPFTGGNRAQIHAQNGHPNRNFLDRRFRQTLSAAQRVQGRRRAHAHRGCEPLKLAVGAYTLFISANGKTVAKTIIKR